MRDANDLEKLMAICPSWQAAREYLLGFRVSAMILLGCTRSLCLVAFRVLDALSCVGVPYNLDKC